jgi:transcriptional regulator with AAA-type ATPase domain/tetratricopeptide (TPR) repeat protein
MQALRAQIRHLSRFDVIGHAAVPTVVLQGETGTGKGLVARVIHDSGPRARGPFLEVNCAAIPETLLEAELFGFAAGAFTDARRAKPGLFEAATGGTLFLDEIDALPLPLQAKLLTVIEARLVRRLGAVHERPVDVKLIVATQVPLSEQVPAGRFRPDLYHRLAVVVLTLPPLRARGEDILVLARALLQHYGAVHGVGLQRLSEAAAAWLLAYRWPGNVRELSHLIARVVLLDPAAVIEAESLARLSLPLPEPVAPAAPVHTPETDHRRDDTERIAQALRQTRGNVVQAAHLLGMSRGGLRYRMQRLGLGRSSGTTIPPPTAVVPGRVTPHPALTPGLGEGAPLESPVGWEPKPVAVLAIEATWPERGYIAGAHYEPWTAATRWQQCMAEKVAGFGGGILQGSPTLLLVAFGLPRTLEQLPQRAVQAALAIRHLATEGQEAMPEWAAPVVRLAVHLGTLLVEGEADEPPERWLAVGETLAVPVRLLGHAAPGELLVSAPIGRLLAGWAEVQARPLPLGAGQSDQSIAYSVGGLLRCTAQAAWLGTRPWSPFLGRERELATLRAVLAQVESGRGQVVGIVGEPGMGKSRLLEEWRQHLSAHGVASLVGDCLSYGNTTPYLPVLDLLRAHCGITPADGVHAIVEKVHAGLRAVGMAPATDTPYLLYLLGVPAETEHLVGISPETLKAKTFEALQQLSLHRSQRHPLLIAVENLHWIDPTSEEFFASLVDRLPGHAILFLTTYRPGYRPPWMDKSYSTQITLPPLSAQDSLQIVLGVLQRDTIPASLAQAVHTKAQGNPFFLEELAQTLADQGVLEAGARGQPPFPTPAAIDIQLPPTVQAVLGARMDRLAPAEKSLLQCAAVIGMDVPVELLQTIAEPSEVALQQALAHLQAVEFLYETRRMPDCAYTFKHALTREVAYESLGPARRRALHAHIVAALEARTGERVHEQVERLAHHALRGEVWDKALTYIRQAGEKALVRSAHREAVGYFEQALGVLPHLPETRATREQAIDLQLALRNALFPSGDFGRLLACLREAEALATALDDTRRLAQVSIFISNHFFTMGTYDQAIIAGQRALTLTMAGADDVQHALANRYLGVVYKAQGNYRRALACFGQAAAFFTGARRHERFGQLLLPAVFSRAALAGCHAELGQFAEGRAFGDEGLQIAEAVAHPASLMFAIWGRGLVDLAQGNVPCALPLLERALDLCQEADLPTYFPRMAAAVGAAYILEGRIADAVRLLTQALEQSTAADRVLFETLCRLGLGEAQERAGHLEEAHAHAERALMLARAHQEQSNQAYALRLLGAITARRGPATRDQAGEYYHQALALAEELGMRPLQAHCQRGLGTLYAKAGQVEQARMALSTAIMLYRVMDMAFWLRQAEAALGQTGNA